MATGTFYPAASGDDGSRYGATSFSASGENIAVGNSGSSAFHGFFRFPAVTVPRASTITAAYLRIYANAYQPSGATALKVSCEAADDPAAPTTYGDYDGRAKTTSQVDWDVSSGAWDVDYSAHDSPSLVEPVQEVVDRPGFASGQAIIVYVEDDSASATKNICSIDLSAGAYKVELHLEWTEPEQESSGDAGLGGTADCQSDTGRYTDGAGMGADADAYNETGKSYPGAGLGDAADAQNYTGLIADGAGLGDAADFSMQYPGAVSGGGGLGDVADGYSLTTADFADAGCGDSAGRFIEVERRATAGAGFGDACDCISWARFLRLYGDQCIILYLFTLTGAADGLADVEIPISSFQGRLRNGDPTYLSVVIPDQATWAADVYARPNGQMVIEMAYLLSGVEQHREEIARVDLEEIRTDQGSKSQSITLTGHVTQSYGGQSVALPDVTYIRRTDGLLSARCARPDMWLRPGDTVTAGEYNFVADLITYIVSTKFSYMEVSEQ